MSKRNITIVGPVDIERIDRLRSSRYGNPRYEIITTEHGTFRTAPDAAISYELPNWFGRYGRPNRHAAYLRLDGRGNVVYVTNDSTGSTDS